MCFSSFGTSRYCLIRIVDCLGVLVKSQLISHPLRERVRFPNRPEASAGEHLVGRAKQGVVWVLLDPSLQDVETPQLGPFML